MHHFFLSITSSTHIVSAFLVPKFFICFTIKPLQTKTISPSLRTMNSSNWWELIPLYFELMVRGTCIEFCFNASFIKTCSLTKNFEDLECLVKIINTNFDIIAMSETRLLKNTKIVKNINLPDFSYEFTPTESIAG